MNFVVIRPRGLCDSGVSDELRSAKLTDPIFVFAEKALWGVIQS